MSFCIRSLANRCKDFDTFKSMNRTIFSLIALLFAAVPCISGCQSLSEKNRQDAMEHTLALYANTLRWHGPDKQAEFLKDPAAMPAYNNVRVLGYEVISKPAPMEENLVSQVVQIRYIYNDTQMIRTIEDRQLWESDADGKIWLRVNPPPPFSR